MTTPRLFHVGLMIALIAVSGVAVAAGSGSKKVKGVAPSAEKAVPLAVGQSLPDVKVTTEEGKSVKLSKALEGKPAAIVFYRGHWCPYCMKHLAGLKEIAGELDALGVNLVAITPDKSEYIAEAKAKADLSIDIYSDGKLDAAKAMGVAYQMDPDMAERYKKHLVESTGHDTGQLPLPSVFLTDAAGKITWVFSNPDFKVRLSNEEFLAAVKKAQG